jgi:uncharacterized coiled-coil protein SlyX
METSVDRRLLRVESAVVLMTDFLTDLNPDLSELKQLVALIRADVQVRTGSYQTDAEAAQST